MEEKSKYPKIYPPCLSLSFTQKKKFSALFVFSVVVDCQQQQKHTGGKKTVEIYQHMARHIAQCQVRPPADPSTTSEHRIETFFRARCCCRMRKSIAQR